MKTDSLKPGSYATKAEAKQGGSGGATWGTITGRINDQTDLKEKLNAKQGVLIAGTNITISPENVISASGGGSSEWGSITGNIQDQTDLQNALAAKEDKNRVTIDGVSYQIRKTTTDEGADGFITFVVQG